MGLKTVSIGARESIRTITHAGAPLYIKTHVRIETPTYGHNGHGVMFASNEAREAFHSEAREVLEQIGFTCGKPRSYRSGACDTVTRGKERLYLHPQDFSGLLSEQGIETLVQSINEHATLFRVRHVDRYDLYQDLSPAQVAQAIAHQAPSVRAQMCQAYRTSRRSRYFGAARFAGYDKGRVCNRFCVLDSPAVEDAALRAIDALREALVDEGYLVTYESPTGTLYRAANKGELRTRRLSALTAA